MYRQTAFILIMSQCLLSCSAQMKSSFEDESDKITDSDIASIAGLHVYGINEQRGTSHKASDCTVCPIWIASAKYALNQFESDDRISIRKRIAVCGVLLKHEESVSWSLVLVSYRAKEKKWEYVKRTGHEKDYFSGRIDSDSPIHTETLDQFLLHAKLVESLRQIRAHVAKSRELGDESEFVVELSPDEYKRFFLSELPSMSSLHELMDRN